MKNLTKKELLKLARKHFTGITKDFTKDDIIYNLSKLPQYAKPKKNTKKSLKKSETIRTYKIKKTNRGRNTTRQTEKPNTKNKTVLDINRKRNSPKKNKQSNRSKKTNLKTTKIRGKNTFSINARDKAENLSDRIAKDGVKKELTYYLNKNKPIKNRKAKEPKAIVIITKVKTQEGTTKTFSKISDPDFRVTPDSALEFIKKGTEGAGDLFEDFYGEEIDSILNVSVKFIY